MNRIIKRILITTIVLLVALCIKVNANTGTDIKIIPSQESNTEFNIKMRIDDIAIPVSNIRMDFKYSKEVFNKITENDFNRNRPWSLPTMSIEEDEEAYYVSMFIDSNVDIKNPGIILDFYLKTKDNNIVNSDKAFITIEYFEACDVDGQNPIKEDKNITYSFNNNSNDLYLRSQLYKIGDADDNKTNEYVQGDQYLYRVSPNTKISDFKNNLSTNGTIIIYNSDNTQVTDLEELVKTGMKIKISKEDCTDIELEIGVIGDINGDGKVTATDIAGINQQLLREINLEGIQLISADISSDRKVTVTDIAAMIQMVLKELIV